MIELNELLKQMEEKMKKYDLSDGYLSSIGCQTTSAVGIGEYSYGITMMPCSMVYPHLKELKDLKERLQC